MDQSLLSPTHRNATKFYSISLNKNEVLLLSMLSNLLCVINSYLWENSVCSLVQRQMYIVWFSQWSLNWKVGWSIHGHWVSRRRVPWARASISTAATARTKFHTSACGQLPSPKWPWKNSNSPKPSTKSNSVLIKGLITNHCGNYVTLNVL